MLSPAAVCRRRRSPWSPRRLPFVLQASSTRSCFLRVVAVFPANQSGNAAFLGLSIGGTSPAPGWAPPVAIGSFMLGAVSADGCRCGSVHVASLAMLLGLELVLLLGLAIGLAAAGGHEPFTTTGAEGCCVGRRRARRWACRPTSSAASPESLCRPPTRPAPSPTSARPSARRPAIVSEHRGESCSPYVGGADRLRRRGRARVCGLGEGRTGLCCAGGTRGWTVRPRLREPTVVVGRSTSRGAV